MFWLLKYPLNFSNSISHLYINFFWNNHCNNTAYTACYQICTMNMGSVSQLPDLEACCLHGYTFAYVLFNIHLQLFVSVKFWFWFDQQIRTASFIQYVASVIDWHLKRIIKHCQLNRSVASIKIRGVINPSYVFQQFWFHMAIFKIRKSDWTHKSQQ